MKKIIKIGLLLFLFNLGMMIVKAEDIPEGNYDIHEYWYYDLKIVDSDGNDLKYTAICFNDDYSDDDCYNLILQDNGLYLEDYTDNTYCSKCSFIGKDNEETYKIDFYVKQYGYIKSKIYHLTEKMNETYTLEGGTVVNDVVTYSLYDGSDKVDKIVLDKDESLNVSESKCLVVSGTGKKIGDEIACGDEHFYIISNDGKQIKMLAKYNLYVGINVFASFDEGKEFDSLENLKKYVNNNYGNHKYYYYYYNSNRYFLYRIYDDVIYSVEGFGIQNEIAIGVHGGSKGSPEYPSYAEVYDYPRWYPSTMIIKGYGNNYYYDLSVDINLTDDYFNYLHTDDGDNSTDIDWYLYFYNSYLDKRYTGITDTSLITIEEIANMYEDLYEKEFPLEDGVSRTRYGSVISIDLKDYFDDKYNFLWSTTYWTRTIAGAGPSSNWVGYSENANDILFIDTLGNVCTSDGCDRNVGAGVRPLISIDADAIDYSIFTKTDGNGEVSYVRNNDGSVTVKFEAEEGYVLDNLKVTDENGNVINIKDLKFIMPEANVTIEATFKKVENPNTRTLISIGVVSLFILSIVSLIIYNRKYNSVF